MSDDRLAALFLVLRFRPLPQQKPPATKPPQITAPPAPMPRASSSAMLCIAGEAMVEASLATRRRAIVAAAFGDRRGQAT